MNLSGDETFNLSSSSENNFHNSTPPIDNNREKDFLIKDISQMEMDSIKDIHPKIESVIRTNVHFDNNVTTIKPSNFVSYFSKKREYFFFYLN